MAASSRSASTQKRSWAAKCLLVLMGLFAAKHATQLFVQPACFRLRTSIGQVALRQGMQDESTTLVEDTESPLLGFGKHKERTYADVLENEPDYCQWVLQSAMSEDASTSMTNFAEYIQAERPDLEPRPARESSHTPGAISFGKHRGKSYEDMVRHEPDYCQWVLEQVEANDDENRPTMAMLDFADWLQANKDLLDEVVIKETTSPTVKFGKYKGETYENVLASDPDYCQWVLETSEQDGGSHLPSYPFVQWLKTKDLSVLPATTATTVKFGKHKGKEYEAVLDEDLEYCQWILDLEPETMGKSMMPFYEWLKTQAEEASEDEEATE